MVLDQRVESTYYPEASSELLLYVLSRIAGCYSVHVVVDDDDDETRTSSCGEGMRWSDAGGAHQRIWSEVDC